MPSVRVRNRSYSVLVTPLDAEGPATVPLATDPSSRRAGTAITGSRQHLHSLNTRPSLPSFLPARSTSPAPMSPVGSLSSPTNSPIERRNLAAQQLYNGPLATAFEASGVRSGSSAPQRHQSLAGSTAKRNRRRSSIIASVVGGATDSEEHGANIVNHLDAIDDHVATVTGLTNAANSILIPPLYNRAPILDLQSITSTVSRSTSVGLRRNGTDVELGLVNDDVHDLDRHVAEVLSNRAKLRRQLLGLRDFLKTPIGILTAIYGFLVVFWGAAIVLFLLKWINLHDANKQGLWVEISSQVVNALFTITGVGLIPWRARDTFWIGRILHYKRLVRRRRMKRGLQPLPDENDLPDPLVDTTLDDVLTAKQQAELRKRQEQFSKSQTWYHPHPTVTHKAFPIRTALAICLFNDLNSIGQCILCGCMWGLNRFERPPWTTGSLIPFTFLCGIAAAVLIWHGGKRTRKTEEVKEKLRKALEAGHSEVEDDAASTRSSKEATPIKREPPASPLSRPASLGPAGPALEPPRKSTEIS